MLGGHEFLRVSPPLSQISCTSYDAAEFGVTCGLGYSAERAADVAAHSPTGGGVLMSGTDAAWAGPGGTVLTAEALPTEERPSPGHDDANEVRCEPLAALRSVRCCSALAVH